MREQVALALVLVLVGGQQLGLALIRIDLGANQFQVADVTFRTARLLGVQLLDLFANGVQLVQPVAALLLRLLQFFLCGWDSYTC